VIPFFLGLLAALIPCAIALKQAHRVALQQIVQINDIQQGMHASTVALRRLADLRGTQLQRAHSRIKRLRANAIRLRSVACAAAWTVGQFDAYLARTAANYSKAASVMDADSVSAVRTMTRAHAADNARFILQGLFYGP
jgi:hypothetical protein